MFLHEIRKNVTLQLRFVFLQVFTFGWREDVRVGDPMHTKKVCFDAISHNSPVTLYDCHGMKGNQLWRYRKVWDRKVYTSVKAQTVNTLSPWVSFSFLNILFSPSFFFQYKATML